MKSIFLSFFVIIFTFFPLEKAFGFKVKKKEASKKTEVKAPKQNEPSTTQRLAPSSSKTSPLEEDKKKIEVIKNKKKEVEEKDKKEEVSIPHVFTASKDLKPLQYTSIKKIRVFVADKKGLMTPIPYQIDQKDEDGDYILKDGSGSFIDDVDEMCIMSEDAGEDVAPKTWTFKKPEKLYKLLLKYKEQKKAIYVGVYTSGMPPSEATSPKTYVSLDLTKNKVETDYYRYLFNKKNYLMVEDFFIKTKDNPLQKLLSSSTFYLKLNLKYFFSISINHKDVNSELEAHKVGPIRAIARVNFNYKIMAMKIDLGMYTEVVFFKNAIFLPAILENPIDSKTLLNKESDFYYGFALKENPGKLKIDSNMKAYPEIDKSKTKESYWFSNVGSNYQIYLEFEPSKIMLKDNITPRYFAESKTAKQVLKRTEKPRPPGKSRANMLLTLDVGELSEGEHEIELALFVDNLVDSDRLNSIRAYSQWDHQLTKIEN